jgi:hypothetical protein
MFKRSNQGECQNISAAVVFVLSANKKKVRVRHQQSYNEVVQLSSADSRWPIGEY